MTTTRPLIASLFALLCLSVSTAAFSSTGGEAHLIDLTGHWAGLVSLVLFFAAYTLVILEEQLHLRKSKPVMVAAGIIWALVAVAYAMHGDKATAGIQVRHNLLEYAELFLFLLAAMTYINTMDERGVFKMLRSWLINKGFTLRQVFWITGLLAFFISPIADNLTTALLMVAVVMAVGGSNKKFVVVSCINVVVAANAGGAFSPFGDITTLMVWQKGIVQFSEFFAIFLPSVVNWIVPATIMSMTVSNERPEAIDSHARLRHGGLFVIFLFLLTISMAVMGHSFLHLPPVIGMMTGLGLLKFFGFYLKRRDHRINKTAKEVAVEQTAFHLEIEDKQSNRKSDMSAEFEKNPARKEFNIFGSLERAEWDTLMFFYGVVLCVGGLGTFGYLAMISEVSYGLVGPTWSNIGVGILSAIIDNIPVMFAVLTMMPEMGHNQWLLVTLTAGVGGSLLSIGSAAGVAVMGQARGVYTFFAHLKWTWAIALGYIASIIVHLLINGT